jgi:DNA repair photolyase
MVTTKAPLVERDVDLLAGLASHGAASVSVTLPFLDPVRARAMEPWVASPQRRLETIARLAAAGVPVGVVVAPVIPGLNDEEIPRVLAAAREAGATRAHWLLLRLPGPVKEVFEERLRATLPARAERVLHRIRETRDGKLYDARFGVRGRGEGEYARTIAALFEASASRLGFQGGERAAPSTFRRPRAQMTLFGDGC